MDKTELRFIREYESNIPEPNISFKEVAAKSNIDLEKRKPSIFNLYRAFGITFAAIAVFTLAVVIPKVINDSDKKIEPAVAYKIEEGTYSCVSFDTTKTELSLEGLTFVVEKSEEPNLQNGQIKTNETDINSGLLVTFTNTFLKDCTFSNPTRVSGDEFEYTILNMDNLKLKFGNDHKLDSHPIKINVIDTSSELGTLISKATFQKN